MRGGANSMRWGLAARPRRTGAAGADPVCCRVLASLGFLAVGTGALVTSAFAFDNGPSTRRGDRVVMTGASAC